MTIRDLKQNTYKGQLVEIWAYPNIEKGFKGVINKVYFARRIPKKYDNLKVVYWATENRQGLGSILIVDCEFEGDK